MGEASRRATKTQEASPTATKAAHLPKGLIFFGNLTPNPVREGQYKTWYVHCNNFGTAGQANIKAALPLHQHELDSCWKISMNNRRTGLSCHSPT